MAGEFEPIQLGEVASVRSGFAFKSSDWTESGVPVVKISNVKDGRLEMDGCSFVSQETSGHAPDASLRAGDILIAMTGYIGDVALVRDHNLPVLLNQRVGRFEVRDQKRLYSQFLFYVLRNREVRQEIEGLGYGSAQPNVSPTLIHGVKIPLPPLPEQRAIAHILGTLDDRIEANRRMAATLDEVARAIFRDWFVDFGPTRAKMEGRAPYLAPKIWSHFPNGLDDGVKPEGWIAGSLSDFALLNSESWSRANYPETVNYVDLSSTKWGTIEAITPFTSDTAPSRAQRILRPGDTIVATVRPGNGSYAFVSEQGLTGSTGFAALRPRKEIFREVVYLAATSMENIDRLSHLADGGAYPAVRPELVAATALVTAPEEVFSAFNATTGSLIDRVETNKQENRTLASTRDLLLPKLMSGEVRVTDAEAFLKARGL